MKKLMIALTAAIMAVSVNAAQAKWTFNASNIYNGGGATTATKIASGMDIYVFDLALTSATDIYGAWKNGTTDFSEFTGIVASGKTGAGSFTLANKVYGTQSFDADPDNGIPEGMTYSYNYMFAIVDGDDKIYLSDASGSKDSNKSATAKVVGFGSLTDKSKTIATSMTTGSWNAVPEPTSGLLMLLGMAGLALRRRRA